MNEFQQLYNWQEVRQQFHPKRLFALCQANLSAELRCVKQNELLMTKGTICYLLKGTAQLNCKQKLPINLTKGTFLISPLHQCAESRETFTSLHMQTDGEILLYQAKAFEQLIRSLQEGWLFLYVQEQIFYQRLERSIRDGEYQ
ncbi:hypothetical protein [Listeria ilorinensis]|uniref:hypothetical protein n=1 Tax=Listeria ilorinensis TaxID=2867439 RepID=UPI001EF4E956|nr:hypothetical protein [Listeria ilorinensis]